MQMRFIDAETESFKDFVDSKIVNAIETCLNEFNSRNLVDRSMVAPVVSASLIQFSAQILRLGFGFMDDDADFTETQKIVNIIRTQGVDAAVEELSRQIMEANQNGI
jgi:hypothetical protein